MEYFLQGKKMKPPDTKNDLTWVAVFAFNKLRNQTRFHFDILFWNEPIFFSLFRFLCFFLFSIFFSLSL
jgi:hypothetical protein